MKKFLLSFTVLGLFFLYGLHVRNEASEAKVTSQTANASVLTTSKKQLLLLTTTPAPQEANGGFKDGQYLGSVEDALYGDLQVRATISDGKLTDISFLQYPNDRPTSKEINEDAIVYFEQEAIQVQSANVDIVSGATDSWKAFRRSLQTALIQAQS